MINIDTILAAIALGIHILSTILSSLRTLVKFRSHRHSTSNFQTLERRMDRIDSTIQDLSLRSENQWTILNTQMSSLQTDMSSMQTEMSGMQTDMRGMRNDLSELIQKWDAIMEKSKT